MEMDPITRENKPVRLVDFDNPDNNVYHAINQFKIDRPGQLKGIRPDTVLFINGLAIVVIEAKHPLACESPVDEAIEQILRYSNQRGATGTEGCEDLFVFNALNIATCKEQAKYGAVCATSKHFYIWRDPYPEEAGKRNPQEILILSTCKPARLLDLIENFSAVVDEDGIKYKVVARYQQYRTVLKQIDRLRNKTGKARNGTVWHTTGSGKSITMMFLVRKLRRTPDLKDFKVILVVDRVDLERQLETTAKLAHETITNVDSRGALDALASQSGNLNIVMVHKFVDPSKQPKNKILGGAVPTFEAFPVINKSDRIILIVDESHRSQGGDMGDNLFAAFPNAVMAGFTGTPLLAEERKTTSRFGEYVDKRAAHLYRLAIEKALSTKENSLREAGKYDEADELKKVHAAVVISGDGTNEDLWVTEERKRSKDLNAIETFKQKFKKNEPHTYLAFLVVCDMLITGFDAPIEQVLYLDKMLKEHTLLQAIARANRVAEGKTHGLIVDYIGVLENLSKAFEMYEDAAQRQILDGLQSIDDEIPKARERFNLIVQFFEKRGVKKVYEFLTQEDNDIDRETYPREAA